MNDSQHNQTDRQMSDYTEFKVGVMINLCYPPFIILLGSAGNILSFLVYSRKKLSKRPISVYMRVLAVLDTSMLTVLFVFWLHTNFLLLHLTEQESRCFLLYLFFLFST